MYAMVFKKEEENEERRSYHKATIVCGHFYFMTPLIMQNGWAWQRTPERRSHFKTTELQQVTVTEHPTVQEAQAHWQLFSMYWI